MSILTQEHLDCLKQKYVEATVMKEVLGALYRDAWETEIRSRLWKEHKITKGTKINIRYKDGSTTVAFLDQISFSTYSHEGEISARRMLKSGKPSAYADISLKGTGGITRYEP